MITEPVVYLRGSLAEAEEIECAKEWFYVAENRVAIPPGSLVIPRYSALPYYEELEEDLRGMDCTIMNSFKQHSYVADMANWYHDLEAVTPKTWFSVEDMPKNGPFVMKGATNSKKFEWNTHMFAADRYEAAEVACRLSQDSMVGTQTIYGREYVKLKQLAEGLNGLKICEEYRFFVLNGEVVDAGFYWSSHVDDLDKTYCPWNEVPIEFINGVTNIVAPNIPFFVVDVARTEDGGWIVVELNDGQMSGLSEIDPFNFYKTLRYKVDRMLK